MCHIQISKSAIHNLLWFWRLSSQRDSQFHASKFALCRVAMVRLLLTSWLTVKMYHQNSVKISEIYVCEWSKYFYIPWFMSSQPHSLSSTHWSTVIVICPWIIIWHVPGKGLIVLLLFIFQGKWRTCRFCLQSIQAWSVFRNWRYIGSVTWNNVQKGK